MTYRSEIRKFVDAHFGGPTKAAAAIGVNYYTVRKWEQEPTLMLKYLLDITDATKCTVMDVVEAVEAQKKANG
jgi:hypothetical protein